MYLNIAYLKVFTFSTQLFFMRLVQLDIYIDILLVAYYYDRAICYLYNLLTYTFDQGHCQWKTNIFLEKNFRCNFPALA